MLCSSSTLLVARKVVVVVVVAVSYYNIRSKCYCDSFADAPGAGVRINRRSSRMIIMMDEEVVYSSMYAFA